MACANIMAPTGGQKDEIAPTIRSRSLKDSALEFKGGKIVFEFNEFIQIKDLNNQLVITPLQAKNPEVTVQKRKLIIHFPDSLLQDNTTYTVNFGNAIQDLHEGNSYTNFGFTFSTGKYFDSLQLKGQVVQAMNGLPDTAAWVLLYPEQTSDSAIYKQKPMYASKANGGKFQFSNLPARRFKMYALQDGNHNLMYDPNIESIGFLQTSILAGDELQGLTLYTFQEPSIVKDTNTSTQSGTKEKRKEETKIVDKSLKEKLSYMVNADTLNKTKRTFDIQESLAIRFERKLKSVDETKIRLFQDQTLEASAVIELDSTKQLIYIRNEWLQDVNYTLKLLKGFAQDSTVISASAAEFNFRTKRKSDYGILSVVANPGKNNWLELFREGKLVSRKQIKDSLVTFPMLLPANYQLQQLVDENGDGKWTSGNLMSKIQPEKVLRFHDEITIKANWENKIRLEESAPSTKKKGDFKH